MAHWYIEDVRKTKSDELDAGHNPRSPDCRSGFFNAVGCSRSRKILHENVLHDN